MQRWKHAGRGPKYTLVLGILLGVASIVLSQNAYAQSQFGYPGNPATPGIPTGPSLGCTPSGASNASWVCGFNPLTTVKFLVDGHLAGTATSDSNGCVLVVISFLPGEVQIDANAPVHVRHGQNFVTIVGHKTVTGGTVKVGLRLPFSTPISNNNACVVSPTGPTGPPTSGTVTRPTSSTFAVRTTIHGFTPTTLAKVIETPLVISPNRVIMETSLLAAVLAAVLSAGALGAMWSSGGSAPAGAAGGAGAGTPAGAGPPSGTSGSDASGGADPGGASGPAGPSGPSGPSGDVSSGASTSGASRAATAFTRAQVNPTGGGGGGS